MIRWCMESVRDMAKLSFAVICGRRVLDKVIGGLLVGLEI